MAHLPTLRDFFLAHGKATRAPRTVMPFHERIFDAMRMWVTATLPDGKRHLAICMPPRHGKTFIARDLVAWGLGCFPDSEWIYTACTATLAVTQTMAIKNTVSSDWYQRVFPYVGVSATKGRQDNFSTAHGGSVYGVGATGTLTGFGAGKKRPEFGGGIVIDDPLQAADAYSEAEREKRNTWYSQVLYSRRNSDTTPVMLIMQRLHEHDLVGYLLENEPDLWHVLQIPVRNEETGKVLWPETFSEDTARRMEELDPFAFSSQYMQRPTPVGGAMIKSEWIRTYTEPPTISTLLIVMDTALKTGEHNDYSVLSCWGYDNCDVYLLDVERGKWESPDLLDKSRAFLKKHRPRRGSSVRLRGVMIEDKASGTGLIQSLRRDDFLRDMPIIAVQRNRDKVSRVNDVLPFIRAGRLCVPARGAFVEAYKAELAAFSPAMTHRNDDQVDVTVDALQELLQSGSMSRGLDLS